MPGAAGAGRVAAMQARNVATWSWLKLRAGSNTIDGRSFSSDSAAAYSIRSISSRCGTVSSRSCDASSPNSTS